MIPYSKKLGLAVAAVGVAAGLAVGGGLVAAPHDPNKPKKPFEADAAYVREHYTKYEYRVPMRDGVRLFTSVYAPKDDSAPYPLLMRRTPYSVKPYGVDNYPDSPPLELKYYANERFIFVFQDVRGRYGSEGEFVHMRPHLAVKSSPRDVDESSDTYDTIEWLLKNVPNNNGKAGLFGTSYPGFYSAAGMIDAHPALKCVSPQAPIADWFIGDDFHHNGVFYLAHAFRFFSGFGQQLEEPTREAARPFDYKTPDGYEFYLNIGPLANIDEKYFKQKIEFWNELMGHATYDEFWKSRNLLPHLKGIKPAVMTVGGWFDAEDLYGPLNIYHSVERTSPGAVNTLVMGPWAHGDWHRDTGDSLGNVDFHQKTSQYFRQKIELPFLKHYLKDAEDPKLPEAYVFETGTNQWRRYEAWPPANTVAKTLYLQAEGKLGWEPAAASGAAGAAGGAAFDEYVSDPERPVPFIPNVAIGMTREHMLDDQRFAASRPDVLVYQTEPLEEDVTIAGPIDARLFVSTTGTDADWVVKLLDVYHGDLPNPEPNPQEVQMGGYQQLVRGEAMRGKFRNSFEKPEPFEPGKVAKVEYALPDAYHTFRRGHRIMVQIQSSWFPLIDRNPQKFVDIYKARREDFEKATQRVYRGGESGSAIGVRVIGR
jgi:putative CocE/NonD family hydrolase